MKTGYLWDKEFLGHFTSTVHPENPKRAEVLNPDKILKDLPGLKLIENRDQNGHPWALRVHSQNYLNEVNTAVKSGRFWLDGGDTAIHKDSYHVALRSVSGALNLADAVAKKEVDNGFAAIRPPGHHARKEKAKGFCIFNNVAICARYLQEQYGFKKILIVDFDVHPADGTFDIFYEDPSVHVVSIHQDGILSPHIGLLEQNGQGEGEGTKYNIPLPERSNETEYYRALEPVLLNASSRCKPDFVLISAGFDAHKADPLAQMNLEEASFTRLTEMVKTVAADYCDGRIVSLLEGGYNTHVLAACVRSHLIPLME